MHLGHKKVSRPQAVVERMADPARRREIAEQAADAANRIATGVAKRSVDLGSQVGERLTDVAHAVTEEGHALMEHQGKKLEKNLASTIKAKKPRKHRLRKVVLLTGAGAAAAYFLDPNAGAERRAAVLRRTSTSAQTVGDGLDKAARVAHQTADATATDHDPHRADGESLGSAAHRGSATSMGSTTP
ncbi:MAG: hypothetical protein NVSMB48_19430 [Marmoricola sp.]